MARGLTVASAASDAKRRESAARGVRLRVDAGRAIERRGSLATQGRLRTPGTRDPRRHSGSPGGSAKDGCAGQKGLLPRKRGSCAAGAAGRMGRDQRKATDSEWRVATHEQAVRSNSECRRSGRDGRSRGARSVMPRQRPRTGDGGVCASERRSASLRWRVRAGRRGELSCSCIRMREPGHRRVVGAGAGERDASRLPQPNRRHQRRAKRVRCMLGLGDGARTTERLNPAPTRRRPGQSGG